SSRAHSQGVPAITSAPSLMASTTSPLVLTRVTLGQVRLTSLSAPPDSEEFRADPSDPFDPRSIPSPSLGIRVNPPDPPDPRSIPSPLDPGSIPFPSSPTF